MQFWKISTNDAPLWLRARFITSISCFCAVSIPRATNRAPEPRANSGGDTGLSSDPVGVDGERVPMREVGEYWPLVSP
jgi:hypothetical protein